MTGNDVIFATPPSKTSATGATTKPPAPFMASGLKEKPVVLDMGEASREEGFRLNGCR